jgi:hypothetical protein
MRDRKTANRMPFTVAEKVGVIEAAEFFKKRAGKARGQGLMKFLCTATKTAPPEEEVALR